MVTVISFEKERDEYTIESMAARTFDACDDHILGDLPSNEEMASHGSELAALMRMASVILTKDDAQIESCFKDRESFDNWLNILDRIDKTIDVEHSIVKLLETAGNRLLVGASRFKMQQRESRWQSRNDNTSFGVRSSGL